MSNKSDTGLITFLIIWLGLAIAAVVGAIANIVWIFKAISNDTASGAEFWVAVFGVIAAPLGAIHGWIVILT